MRNRYVVKGRRGRGLRGDPGGIRLLGAALMALGLVLLFLCIPGWAWLALGGVLLLLTGYLLISANVR